MACVPFIPETAPFTPEQRAWLNGFLAGLFAAQAPPSHPAASSLKPSEPLLMLFGSQTGTAEGLAKRLEKQAESHGFAPRVLALNDCEHARLLEARKLIIVSSTWGDGDPPDNAVNFWNWLNSDSAPRLENLHFAVLGLGDKNYSDFCGASKKFDARLEALGARRLVPRGECDVDYESAAQAWTDGLWNKLASNGSTNGSSNGHCSTVAPESFSLSSSGGEGRGGEDRSYSKSNPFSAPLLKNILLSKPGSAKEVRHFEISLADSGLQYEVGDALGVLPSNCPMHVDALLANLRCSADTPIQLESRHLSLREALTNHLDITRPSTELLKSVARCASSIDLATLLAAERERDLKHWLFGRDVLDVLTLLEKPLPVEELIPLLRKLSPRLYSISSSPKGHPAEVHITVSAVRYECFGRPRKGVASTFLADRVCPQKAPEQSSSQIINHQSSIINIFLQPSLGFKPPLSGDTPMIMIGPGTGIAPFRAFLQERQAMGERGKNWLFFGDQKRATDFLYEEQLTSWLKSGLLTRLDLAFSRDQAEKVYVQHRLRESAAEVWAWLESGAHFYVCGEASRMAKDVDAVLHEIIQTVGGKRPEQAQAYVQSLKSQKRYQRDIY